MIKAIKRSGCLLICAILIGGWTTLAEARVIRFSILLPAGGPGDPEMKKMFDHLNRETGGEVQVKVYAGGVAGDEVDVIRQMRVNRIHMGSFTGQGLGQIVPEIRVLEAPGLIRSYEEEDYIKEVLFDHFAEEYSKKGFTLLGLGGGGFVYVFSKKEMTSLKELQRFRMWIWKNDPLAETFFPEMGMNTIPLNLGDVITGLETGMIDTLYNTPMGCTALRWHTRCRYMLDYPATMILGGILMNKRTFQEISPSHQRILEKTITKSTREQVELMRRANETSKKMILDIGVQIVQPSREVKNFIAEASKKGTEKCIERGLFSREMYERVSALLEEYRSGGPQRTSPRSDESP